MGEDEDKMRGKKNVRKGSEWKVLSRHEDLMMEGEVTCTVIK